MRGFEPLPRSFFEPSAKIVAPNLLGHWLLRQTPEGICGGAIVETEAYLRDDPACHAAMGPTPRNQVMFGEPGYGYVYFIYGCHYCVNAVCSPKDVGEAVLIRAVEPDFGLDSMRLRRPVARAGELTNGPAKLCQALAIDRRLNGADLCGGSSAMIIARNPQWESFRGQHGPVATSPRIGISKAARLPLRFFLKKSSYVS